MNLNSRSEEMTLMQHSEAKISKRGLQRRNMREYDTDLVKVHKREGRQNGTEAIFEKIMTLYL